MRDFLAQTLVNTPIPRETLAAVFEDALQNGKAFVLLDGLDEVAQAADRIEISRQIDALATHSEAGNRVLVTSRIAGYREARLNSAFAQFTLRDMERGQIKLFLTRWCVAVEKSLTPNANPERWTERGHGERDAILREIDGNQGVKRLAKNPLLLTILALIHRNGAKLPKRRIELYELATKTLLRDWRLHHAGSEARVVEEHEALELLGPLAYWMHENEPTGLMRAKWTGGA